MPRQLFTLALLAVLLLPVPAWAIWALTEGGDSSAWTILYSGGSSRTIPADSSGAFLWSSEILNPGESRSALTHFDYAAPSPVPTAMRAPEPGTGLLMGLGLAGLAIQARRARLMQDSKELAAVDRSPA